jgi:hypothetical protein
MILLFSNNAHSTLAGAVSDVATSMLLQAGTGDFFPNPSVNEFFSLTITSQLSAQDIEIVYVTARAGDTLTVLRGRESTTPRSWLAGDFADNMVTAGGLTKYTQDDELLTAAGGYADDLGTNNAAAASFLPIPYSIASYAGAPLRIRRPSGISNTGPMTQTVNTLTGNITRDLVNASGIPLIQDELAGPCVYTCVYDPVSDAFRLQSFSFPPAGMKILLAANVAFYVNAASGNDANAGTSSLPWRTLQHAYDYITARYDFSMGFTVTVSCTGTFVAGVLATQTIVGGSAANIVFYFQSGAQVNVINNSCFATFSVNSGFTIQSTGTPVALTASGTGFNQGCGLNVNSGDIIISGASNAVTFGTCDQAHIATVAHGRALIAAPYSAVVGSPTHIKASVDSLVLFLLGQGGPLTISLAGTYSIIASCTSKSLIRAQSGVVAFTGTPVGQRFSVADVSLIDTNGGGIGFFPGTVAGFAGNTFNYI